VKLGIDFGTTRVVVAHSDRGNYPVVSFEAGDASYEWFPPLVALRAGECKYGWDAWSVQNDPGWTVLRSLKRLLEDAGPQTHVQLGDVGGVPLLEMLAGMADALRTAIRETSSVRPDPGEPLEVMLGVPANANSNQRFLTVDAFRRAGFEVLGLLNEPSAASIEYGHRQRGTAKPEKVLVYDLGGGTFDASLVHLDQRTHSVIASEGIPTLGGDDFDQILAEMALERAGTASESLTASEWFRLQDECRRQKEALNPNTRRIAVDLDAVAARVYEDRFTFRP
jgi:molecular chaperone DnaK (HSP70)